jgi:hypothetical protein
LAERLKFDGVRIIAVSQGIDSHDEQSDVLMAVVLQTPGAKASGVAGLIPR